MTIPWAVVPLLFIAACLLAGPTRRAGARVGHWLVTGRWEG